ncbi:MAG: hypothetical protein J6C26_04100 [Clostridia bacterium]|nr:hypothetical protein [Clostridia bacterium]
MMLKHSREKNNSAGGLLGLLKVLQKKVLLRIVLVGLILVLTLILVFAFTIAWQTNIVQTGGLMFSAETWNFSGEISVSGQPDAIAPGDSGTIGIQLKNESSNLVAASVTVSKDGLNEFVRPRMYFYVDTTVARNEETLSRVYVSSKSSYTYVVFPYSDLQLNEDSDYYPVLKWEWVYDNLGYYVLGQPGTDSFQIDEYIRPIEYEYDPMSTSFDADGNLIQLEGKSVSEFLQAFSQTDGYVGTIDTTAAQQGYYPVSVDANNYGVWAYLCTYDEIQSGATKDSELGTGSATLGSASVVVTGWNSQEAGSPVYNEDTLLQALSSPGFNHVTLSQDVTLTESVLLKSGSQTMLDLNGHTISSSAQSVISAEEGATVMICDGDIVGQNGAENGIYSVGSSVTLNNVNIRDVVEGITVFDHKNSLGLDSSIHLVDCNVVGKLDGLWIYGNGSDSAKNTSVVIEHSTIEGSGYIGVLCNGTYFGTDIRISEGSVIKGHYAAIYFPQRDSFLTVSDSTLEGGTALAVKGGAVRVIDSVIIGIGEANPPPADPANLSKSGFWDTGDGVYLEANYTEWTTTITIEGDNTNISSANGEAVRMYPTGGTHASIVIYGGTYSSDVSEYWAADS